MVLNIILIVMVLGLVACFIRNAKCKNDYVYDLFSKKSTESLKGFSIIMIAIAHICQYDSTLKQVLIGRELTYRLLFSWGAIGVSLFFLLSGYGCYFSVLKNDCYYKWLIKHIIRMFVHFIIVYVFVIALCVLFFNMEISWKEIIIELFTFRMPGSTVWYFKIQILFYIFLILAKKIKKDYIPMIIAALSIIYVLIAKYILILPDFWWKTALCFAMGSFIAKYRDKVKEIIKMLLFKFIILLIAFVVYYILINDVDYKIYVQLPAYMCISFCVAMFWDWLIKGSRMLENIGKCSLDIYLLHIGIVESVMLVNYNLNYKILIFLGVVGIVSFICFFSAEFIDKKLLSVLKL